MEFNITALSLTYPLLAGFVFCVGFILAIKKDLAVLTKEVEMNKENQDKINAKNDLKFETIDAKLDRIIELIMKK